MGVRHALGAIKADSVRTLKVIDKSQAALDSARVQLQSSGAKKDIKFDTVLDLDEQYDVIILSTTAETRNRLVNDLLRCPPRFLLIEKPIGQSVNEAEKLCAMLSRNPNTITSVNLNTRLQECVKRLKCDLLSLDQFRGPKHINVTAGAIGIGSNGVHLIDKCFYLLDADSAVVKTAEIYDDVILSGRGEKFIDFGGWADVRFTRNGDFVGKLSIQIIPTSSYGWNFEVVGANGYMSLDTISGKYTKNLRRADSQLPVYRYAADYDKLEIETFQPENLDLLTTKWLNGLSNGEDLLPNLEYGMKVHGVMFDWLSYMPKDKIKYPIT